MKKVLFLLGQLDDRDVDWLVAKGNKRQLAAGAVLIQEGKRVSDLFLVLDGTLAVFIAALGPKAVDRMSCGDVAGEMSFIDARPPSATVKALDAVTVLAIPRSAISAKLEEEPVFAARFYRAIAMFLSHRLRARNRPRDATQQSINLDEDSEESDELDANAIDTIHLAGSRFDRVLQQLLTR